MKHWFLVLTATAAFTAFAPASQAELRDSVSGSSMRISEPPQRAELRAIEDRAAQRAAISLSITLT